MKLSEIKSNPNNPRVIKDHKFEKLKKSISEFPKMMELRPMVINEDNIVLGGNMRLKALKDLGYKEVPEEWVKRASDLTEEETRRFIIADNVGFGEHDWDLLANEWNTEELEDWGLDGFPFEIDEDNIKNNIQDDNYSKKITVPKYEPTGDKPDVEELFNKQKAYNFIEKIKLSSISKGEKEFLFMAAYRHTQFNYKNIAEYYAHSDKEMQELMEDSALVIIDFNKAIENGYVTLSEEIAKQYKDEHND